MCDSKNIMCEVIKLVVDKLCQINNQCLRTPVSPKRRGGDVLGRMKYTVKKKSCCHVFRLDVLSSICVLCYPSGYPIFYLSALSSICFAFYLAAFISVGAWTALPFICLSNLPSDCFTPLKSRVFRLAVWHLKGQCHEIFYLWFFSSNSSSWAQ